MTVMTDDLVLDDPEDQGLGEAPEDLFQRYYRPVVAFFQHKGFSTEESRDLAQETFFRVYKNRGRFRRESSPATWLFQIAANLYKNQLRSKSAQKRDAAEVALVDAGDPESDDNTLELVLSEERRRLLREALEELPPQMKRAVMLRVTSDMKYREIAEEMKVSIETVKAHLYQARQQLRDRLADYFTDDVT